MKSQDELTQLKTEYETLNNKLQELTEEELRIVTGGLSTIPGLEAIVPCPYMGGSVNVNEVLTNTGTAGMKSDEFDEAGAEIVHRKCF